MILRSGKALKHSSEHSPVANTDCEDIISKLPDALLIHILSLLPDVDACRTSVLSNRWKGPWVFLPYLHVVIPKNSTSEQANEYYDLVDKTLAIRDDMPIHRFFLYCSSECDYKRVHDWLRIVVHRKVHILELTCPRDTLRVIRFSWDLFKTCNTLVELTLEGALELDVAKDNILFPFLKKLNLVSIIYSGDESLVNLITGCRVLEHLCLERRECTDNLKKIKVSSTSLKRLRICFTMGYAKDYEVMIDAPNVEYLYLLSNPVYINHSLTKPLSLVEAYVCTYSYSSIALELLTSISCAKIMTLTYQTVSALSTENLDMPIFPSLVKLIIHIKEWDFLLKLLRNMPNLEHITFLDGFPDCMYMYGKAKPVVLPPDCLPLKMKEITILNYDTITEGDLSYIEHFLKHSNNLEKLRINAHNIRPKRAEQLLTFYHASNLCRIEFMWGTKRRRRPRRRKLCGARAFGTLQQVKPRGNS